MPNHNPVGLISSCSTPILRNSIKYNEIINEDMYKTNLSNSWRWESLPLPEELEPLLSTDIRRKQQEASNLSLDPDRLTFHLRKNLDELALMSLHPDAPSTVEHSYSVIPWVMSSYFGGLAAHRLISKLNLPKLNRTFIPPNSGLIQVKVWRESYLFYNPRGRTLLYGHPNGQFTGAICTGYNGRMSLVEQYYDTFHKRTNYQSANCEPWLWFLSKPIQMDVSVAGSSGAPYRIPFDSLNQEKLKEIWAMVNCRSMANMSTNFFVNSLNHYKMQEKGESSERFFKENCSRCPIKCLMKNNLTPPDEAVIVPDLSRQWLTQPVPVDDLTPLDPIMRWRRNRDVVDDIEWDLYVNQPRHRDSLPINLVNLHMQRLAPKNKEDGANYSSSSALHTLANIPGDLGSSEFRLLNSYPMSV